jgi:hypothetical protein
MPTVAYFWGSWVSLGDLCFLRRWLFLSGLRRSRKVRVFCFHQENQTDTGEKSLFGAELREQRPLAKRFVDTSPCS